MGTNNPSSCTSSIKYLKWQQIYEYEKPFHIFIDIPEDAKDQRETNLVYEDREQDFYDIRGRETQFNLDEHGFAYSRVTDNFDEFNNCEAIELEYLPHVERLIRQNLDEVDEVFLLGFRVLMSNNQTDRETITNSIKKLRSAQKPKVGDAIDLNNPMHKLQPATHSHVGKFELHRQDPVSHSSPRVHLRLHSRRNFGHD